MRRLYLQIYVALLSILALFTLLAIGAWALMGPGLVERRQFRETGALLGELLPAPDRPAEELQATLERLGSRVDADAAVLDAEGKQLAAIGAPLPAPRRGETESHWLRAPGRGPTAALHLEDGRWLVVRHIHHHRGEWAGLLAGLGLLAAAVAVGAYPLVRRLTRRLERLQSRVEALGAGDLSARVEVEGRDEVAELARSFNLAAERIESLVEAQRSMLAGASHELRSPLARIRVASELLAGDERPELRERIARDVGELDELIDELLVASRLEAGDSLERPEDIDLLALVAEESARVEAEVSGERAQVRGDRRLLRRLVRNLLENATRHASASVVRARVFGLPGGGACLEVSDEGPGVPERERERIFEPFYRPPGSAEGQGGGVGLGLSLVRRIARRHGGDARVHGREGGGSRFEVRLRGLE